MICAAVVAAFAIPYIITSILQAGNKRQEMDIKALDSGRDVCIYTSGEYQLIDVEEYVMYTLAGQADLTWEDEMLKVMAVVIRTSIYYQIDENTDTYADSKTKLINEDQLIEIRYEKEELQQMWGADYESNLYRIYKAVVDTAGEVMTYQSAYIVPMYHRISTGNTVSAQEIYGVELPYLQSVKSSEDINADNFSTSIIYSETRIKKLFSENGYSFLSEGTANQQMNGDTQQENQESDTEVLNVTELKVIEATASGFAKRVNVFGTEISGEKFAEILGLESLNFHFDLTDSGYRIITIGQGSCVGLSQYGANAMAKAGTDYKTILKYYYTDIEIEK